MAVDRVAAIVPAAGFSRRFGGKTGKAYVRLAGKPVLAHTLLALQSAPSIDAIQLLVQAKDVPLAGRLIRRYGIRKALPPLAGGNSRSESVANGIRSLAASMKWVVVHDGARPCVSPDLIEKTLKAARRRGAAAAGLPASATVKEVTPQGRVCATLDRKRLWLIQTPQAFRRDWIEAALAKAGRHLDGFWDDAQMLEQAGFKVFVTPGEAWNIKVTHPDDVPIAETILKRLKLR